MNSLSNVMCSPDVSVVVVRQGDGIWCDETGVTSHGANEVFSALFNSHSYARSGGDIGPRHTMELVYPSSGIE